MNQTEQMLQVLSRALGAFGMLSILTQNTTAQHIIKKQIRDLNKAIDYVKETPKNEHDSGDVLNKSGNVGVMREAFRALDFIKAAATPQSGITYQHIKAIEQALAAEPAKLVRLTDYEIDRLMNEPMNMLAILRIAKSHEPELVKTGLHDLTHAIMDAMERVNE